MAVKKRNSSKGKKQGVSGNPQRRAEQIRAQGPRDDTMRQLAYRMAGGAEPAPWWEASHDDVLDQALAADWPLRAVEVENLTCELVGGRLWECFETHREGHHPAQWLVRLTETAGAALRVSAGGASGASGASGGTADGAAEWRKLWPLLCGIALTAPRTPAEAGGTRRITDLFPGIKQPHETALAEAARCAKLLADRGLEFSSLAPAPGRSRRLTGSPVVARDQYGSRFLLAAPFGYEGEATDHWYAWDIDMCWLDRVTGAGAFDSPEEALDEWRHAVGPGASGAGLAPCPPDLTARLLRESLETGPFSDHIDGGEPRELMREYYRERRRAREIAESLETAPAGGEPFTIDMDKARDEFLEWYAARYGSVSSGMGAAVDTITDQWGPHRDVDERVFYACSPHRIEMSAHLIGSGRYGNAEAAVKLMPDWTQWCIERLGLTGDAAARARAAALNAVSTRADATGRFPGPDDSAPFRRPE